MRSRTQDPAGRDMNTAPNEQEAKPASRALAYSLDWPRVVQLNKRHWCIAQALGFHSCQRGDARALTMNLAPLHYSCGVQSP